jgi:hypothetical protein
MDYEISRTLLVEAPQVAQHGGLHRLWPWPGVIPIAEITLGIGQALVASPAPKPTAKQFDPVFQSFLSSFLR